MLFIGAGVLFSYLIGSIPFGLLLGKWKGKDLRLEGSKNIGATNAGRVLGKKFFFLVLALDLLKGLMPTLFFPWLAPHLNITDGINSFSLFCGIAAILGHIFPIYLKFKGGKGVATSAGVFLALMPIPFLISLLVWLLVLVSTKYMSLASMLGALTLAVSFILLDPTPWKENLPTTIVTIGIALLIIIRHRTNIQRLLQGRENPAPFFGSSNNSSKDNSSHPL
ncbi:MAG: glycerol-3-phosphate 1-O-acyltransferase [Planctomycetota bacterium]|nr:MAG: glycerol-3-phosphate 1-O-acyltransferase [Planctomycetota bacterium]